MTKQNKEKTEEQKDMEKDIAKFSSLSAIANSEGGKILIDTNLKDLARAVEILANTHKTISHIEIIGLCADIKSKLDMLKSLGYAGTNAEAAKEALKNSIENTSAG